MVEEIEYQDSIIQTIKRIRTERNVSQLKLSEILGISRGQIGNIENPNYPHKYTLKQIVTICDRLEVPIESVFMPEKKITPECSKAIDSILKNIVRYEC